MNHYGVSFIKGKEIIAKTKADDLKSAYDYFAKLKGIPLNEFKKIFIVIQL